MPQDLTCLHFGERQYVDKDQEPTTNHPWGQRQTWVSGQFWSTELNNYNSTPQMTALFPLDDPIPVRWDQGMQCACQKSQESYQNVEFVGCGDCSPPRPYYEQKMGASDLACCNCCVTKWSENYKSQCCDPVANETQKSAIFCDPENVVVTQPEPPCVI